MQVRLLPRQPMILDREDKQAVDFVVNRLTEIGEPISPRSLLENRSGSTAYLPQGAIRRAIWLLIEDGVVVLLDDHKIRILGDSVNG